MIAVTDFAEPGEVNKEPLLEDRRHRVVELARFGKAPQFFDDFRILARRQEKVRHQPEATGDFAMEGGLVGRWQGRSSGSRRWPLQPRNPSRFRSTRACRQAATAISFWLATNGRGCHP